MKKTRQPVKKLRTVFVFDVFGIKKEIIYRRGLKLEVEIEQFARENEATFDMITVTAVEKKV